MKESDRALLTNLNRCTVTAQITSPLRDKLEAEAKLYDMTLSMFIRSLLEMIDDNDMYSKLLGPIE